MRLRTLTAGLGAALWAAPVLRAPAPVASPLPGATRRRLTVGLAVTSGLVTAASAVELTLADGATTWPVVVLSLFLGVPVLLLARAPLIVWRTMTLGLFASTLLVPASTNYWPWPISAFVVYLGVLFLTALTYSGPVLAGVALLSCALPVLPAGPQERMDDGVIFILFGLVLLVVFLGRTVRRERSTRDELDDEVAQHRAHLVQAAVLAERTHIARELHDLVAHHMALVAIQAEVAPHHIDDLPPEAERSFLLIRDTSREALTEMRRLVSGLRDSDGSDYAPQPGLGDVAALVEVVRRTGTTVDLTLPEVDACPAPVAVSAYRIVQQTLANAVQHSPGAALTVRVEEADQQLVVVVENGPPRASGPDWATRLWTPAEHAAGTSATTGRATPAPGGRRIGQGLVGMRERASLLGGTFDAGPTLDGGFSVRATLPLAPPAAPMTGGRAR